MQAQTYCTSCGTANPVGAIACSACRKPMPIESDATGGVIPYKNPPALIAYYLGLASLFPLLGLPLGIAAVILGVIGLRRRKANPAVKGSIHAWVGIGIGIPTTLFWGLMIVVMVIEASK